MGATQSLPFVPTTCGRFVAHSRLYSMLFWVLFKHFFAAPTRGEGAIVAALGASRPSSRLTAPPAQRRRRSTRDGLPPHPQPAAAGRICPLTLGAMAVQSLFVVNKAGGLMFQRTYGETAPRLTPNDYLHLASTFHGYVSCGSGG